MPPRLELACTFAIELSPPHEMGACAPGVRRIIPIIGGTVSGRLIEGRILPVGADWQTVHANGVAQLDARYAIETGDGAVIEVISQGIRHAPPEVSARMAAGEEVASSEYYMRTAIRLETGDDRYAWVNRSIFLASGGKSGTVVKLDIYRVD